MGVTHQQIIDDVPDRHEAHLGFLAYSSQHDYASVLTPPAVPATGALARVEPAGDSGTDTTNAAAGD